MSQVMRKQEHEKLPNIHRAKDGGISWNYLKDSNDYNFLIHNVNLINFFIKMLNNIFHLKECKHDDPL